MQKSYSQKTVLLIGASRGLGLAMAEEYLKRGWRVIATGRANSKDNLYCIAKAFDGMLEIETVDIRLPSFLDQQKASAYRCKTKG